MYQYQVFWYIVGSLLAVPVVAFVISMILKYLGYLGVARGFEVTAPLLANWIPPVLMILMGKYPPPPSGYTPWAMVVSPPFFWDYYLWHLMEQEAPKMDQIAAAAALFVFWLSATITLVFLISEKEGPKCRAYRELLEKIKSSASETLTEYIDAIASLPRCPSLWKAPLIAWVVMLVMGVCLPGLHTFLWVYLPWLLVLIWLAFIGGIIYYVGRWYV